MMTPKKKKFAKEYIIDLNATQAAIRSGYSKKTAKSQGQRLLTDDDIQYQLAKEIKKREKRTEITGDMIVKELASVAFIKEADFYHDDGRVKVLSELTDSQKGALASFGFKTVHIGNGEYEDIPVFKAQDKIKALEMLGKHFGIFEKDNKLDLTMTVIDPFNED